MTHTDTTFRHGVASGDPEAEGVILWTRVTVVSADPVAVHWAVATTPDLAAPVASGDAVAAPDHDFTVHVDVRGLEPSTSYYYRFETDSAASPVGRTRTAPAGETERVRLGVVSCASWPHGFFNAYHHLAERNVDLVLHLGDYIYEDGEGSDDVGRCHEPRHRLRTLSDYRSRHAEYKTDPDLQRLHQRHPVVAIWDDHDLAGDAWRDGATAHDPDEDGDWHERRSAATRAFHEWLPIRSQSNRDRIFRSFRLGDLAHLMMVDSRLVGRDRPPGHGGRPAATVEDPDRSMLGSEQRDWLRAELRSARSCARWQLLANAVMMAPLRALQVPKPLRSLAPGLVAGGAGINGGQWDGFPEEREQLFEFVSGHDVRNLVVLSGDLHSSWAGQLTLDPGDDGRAVGVEFVAPSVTSLSFADDLAPAVPGGRVALRRLVARQNPHFPFFDLEGHGYVVVDVDADRLQAEFWHVDTVADRTRGERLVAVAQVRDGEHRLFTTAGP